MDDYSLLTSFLVQGKTIRKEVCEAVHIETGKHVELHKYPLSGEDKTVVERNVSHIIRMCKMFRLFPYARQLIQVIHEKEFVALVWESSSTGLLNAYCSANHLTEEQYAALLYTVLQVARRLLSKGIFLKVLMPSDFLVTIDNGILHFLFHAFHKCCPAEIPRKNLMDPFLQKMAQSVFIYNIGNFGRRLLPFTDMANTDLLVMEGVSSSVLHVVEQMLHPNATHRPSFSEAVHSLWISYPSVLPQYDKGISAVENFLSAKQPHLLNAPKEPTRLGEHLMEQTSYLFQCTRMLVQHSIERDCFGRIYAAYVLLWIPWKWTSFSCTRTKSVQTSCSLRTPLGNSPTSPYPSVNDELDPATTEVAEENCIMEYKECLKALRLRRSALHRSKTEISSSNPQFLSLPSLLIMERSSTSTHFKHSLDVKNNLVAASAPNHPNSHAGSPSRTTRQLPPAKACPLPTYLKFSRSKTLMVPFVGGGKAAQDTANGTMLQAIQTFTKKWVASETMMHRIPPPPNTRASLQTTT